MRRLANIQAACTREWARLIGQLIQSQASYASDVTCLFSQDCLIGQLTHTQANCVQENEHTASVCTYTVGLRLVFLQFLPFLLFFSFIFGPLTDLLWMVLQVL